MTTGSENDISSGLTEDIKILQQYGLENNVLKNKGSKIEHKLKGTKKAVDKNKDRHQLTKVLGPKTEGKRHKILTPFRLMELKLS